MQCQSCGQPLESTKAACPHCGSLTMQVTVSPGFVLEYGVVIGLVLAFVGTVLLVVGSTVLSGTMWLGTNLGQMLEVFGVAMLCLTAPVLFATSVGALRLLEGRRWGLGRTRQVAEESEASSRDADESGPRDYALEAPGSVVEHTTLRLVAPESDTEKVPRQA